MAASATGRTLTVRGTGETRQCENVLVGDVLILARQTFVDVSLGRTATGREAAAAYAGPDTFRALLIQTRPAMEPRERLEPEAISDWVTVAPTTALDLSAAAFYLGRDLASDQSVPVGIIDLNLGHHFGISWLDEKALTDILLLHPEHARELTWLMDWMRQSARDYASGVAQAELERYYEESLKVRNDPKPSLGLPPLDNPMYPAAGYNAVIHPLRQLVCKGILLQLGNDYPFVAYRMLDRKGTATDTVELNAAWGDNYQILKTGYRITPATLPHVPGAWRRAFGNPELPIGLILPPASDLDVYAAHNREVRELHRRTAKQEQQIGLILPGMENIPQSGQPADDTLLAERCRSWVRGTLFGQDIRTTGPVFARMDGGLGKGTIHFQTGTAAGLGATQTALAQFETAGPDRIFTPATAHITGETIQLKNDGPILFVRYNWNTKPEQGLENAAGLPAVPFNSDPDWEFDWIAPPEEANLPAEYRLTADQWTAGDIAIINGNIANMATGDSEVIPRRPGPLDIVASPFGPNIYVVELDPGSPAIGKLEPSDVIYGVNGRIFDAGPGVADDAQYHVLAEAITYSESEEGAGRLVLHVRRGSKLLDVEVPLEVLGSYSATTPYYCEKSQNIVRKAEAWMARRYRPTAGLPSEPTGMLHTDLLFLLASGQPEHQGLVRRAVYSMIAGMDPQPVVPGMQSKPWNTGHTSLLLGEYFHATGDTNVLPYLKYQADLSAESQLKPPAETPPGKEAAQSDEVVGGWRHNYPSNPERWMSGYGLLPHAGMSCVMGMLLAREAGLEVDDLALERGIRHFNEGRGEYGFILYAYTGVRRSGPAPINPQAERDGKLSSMNGTLGMAAALYSMLDGYNDTVEICARNSVYAYNNTRHGHGGMFFNNFWTPVGAWAAGEDGFKHFMHEQIWWRELFRRSDGSFNQVGRGGIGVSYALPYVAPHQRLRMLGAPRSAFGANYPAYLAPALEAHRQRDYARCEMLIRAVMQEALPPADVPVVKHLLASVQTLQASIAHDLDLTEKLLAAGRHFYAQQELAQLQGIVAADNPRLQAITATLTSPEGQAAIAAHRSQCEAEARAQQERLGEAKPQAPRQKWHTVLARQDDTWQMKVVEHMVHAPEGWTAPGFDDSGWNTATMPISWTMYHTALFRGTFQVTDPAAIEGLRLRGKLFQQANVVIYLNGEVVAKIDEIGRGSGETLAPLNAYGRSLLRAGENTIAVASRHQRRWGPFRGTYKTADPMWFEIETAASPYPQNR
jgi:hypothetical protein